MEALAIIEIGKDGSYSIYSVDTSSVIYGDGESVAAAKDDFLNTYKEMVQFAKEDNMPLSEDMKDLTFVFKPIE